MEHRQHSLQSSYKLELFKNAQNNLHKTEFFIWLNSAIVRSTRKLELLGNTSAVFGQLQENFCIIGNRNRRVGLLLYTSADFEQTRPPGLFPCQTGHIRSTRIRVRWPINLETHFLSISQTLTTSSLSTFERRLKSFLLSY